MSKKILIVDDSPSVLAILEDMLQDAGYAVVAASDGRSALAKVDADIFDLIITDLTMPVMDGITFMREAKSRPNCKFVPIVMLSSEEDADKIAEAKKSGASTFLRKPFKESQLLAILRVVLGN